MNLEELRRFKPQIEAIAARYDAGDIRVAGSVAQGAARADSDIDLVLRFPHGVWQRLDMQAELEALLGARVDLLSEDSIDPYIRPYLLKDALPL